MVRLNWIGISFLTICIWYQITQCKQNECIAAQLLTGIVKISSIREMLFQQIVHAMMLILQSLSSLRGDICNERWSSHYLPLSWMEEKSRTERKRGENYSFHTSSVQDLAQPIVSRHTIDWISTDIQCLWVAMW